MNSVVKQLSDGTVGAVAPSSIIYQSPSAVVTSTVIKILNFHNLNTTTNRVVEVFRSSAVGPLRRLYKFTIPPEGSAEIEVDWSMASLETIEALADAASEVNYVVSGYQFPTL